jgi:hypothetical protein
MAHWRKDAPIARNWGIIEKVGGGYILAFGRAFGNQLRKVVMVHMYLSKIEETGSTAAVTWRLFSIEKKR